MKQSTAVAMIVEARRQGYVEAKEGFDIACKNMLDTLAHPTIEALQAEIERLNAERDARPSAQKIISDEDGVDDVFITCDYFRMEKMDKNVWWLAVYRGEQRVCFSIHKSKRGVVALVTEDDFGCTCETQAELLKAAGVDLSPEEAATPVRGT